MSKHQYEHVLNDDVFDSSIIPESFPHSEPDLSVSERAIQKFVREKIRESIEEPSESRIITLIDGVESAVLAESMSMAFDFDMFHVKNTHDSKSARKKSERFTNSIFPSGHGIIFRSVTPFAVSKSVRSAADDLSRRFPGRKITISDVMRMAAWDQIVESLVNFAMSSKKDDRTIYAVVGGFLGDALINENDAKKDLTDSEIYDKMKSWSTGFSPMDYVETAMSKRAKRLHRAGKDIKFIFPFYTKGVINTIQDMSVDAYRRSRRWDMSQRASGIVFLGQEDGPSVRDLLSKEPPEDSLLVKESVTSNIGKESKSNLVAPNSNELSDTLLSLWASGKIK